MGKGIIKSGGADGFYNVELTLERDRIDKTIATIDTHVESLTSVIDTIDEGTEKELLKLERNSYIKKKEYLQSNMPEDPTVSAWCADLTEDISGSVGTIEVPGERGIVQIQPGYEDNSIYDAARDGQLQPSIASTPAATFYNLAMLPGWQKWKPTYRYGVISNIDTDANTCDVKLDEVESSQQNLNINQELNLTGIDVSYMSCDSTAFEDGDKVLIKFINQTWEGAQVVGFKDNPKSCEIPCEDITEENLSFDISSDITYQVDTRLLFAQYGTWTPEVNISTSSGMDIDLSIEFERAYGETMPSSAVFVHWLRFILSDSIDLEEGWYYLSYDLNTHPTIVNTEIIPVGEWHPESSITAQTLSRIRIKNSDSVGYGCKYSGSTCIKKWTYDYTDPENPVPIIVDSFVDCGQGYSGSYTECIELKNTDKGKSFHTDALDIQVIMYSSSSLPFNATFDINMGLVITNLSLRKSKMDISMPIDGGVRECRSDDSCVSPATWNGLYVGGW